MIIRKAGFDRTYEELKQSQRSPLGNRFLSFDRTYEELKPGQKTDLLSNAPKGFDRTYEELKQF